MQVVWLVLFTGRKWVAPSARCAQVSGSFLFLQEDFMAKLPESQIDDARETDIVRLIESYGVTLENAGQGEFRGLCPFHSERSPSFTVTPEVGTSKAGRYHCFGCGMNGSAIDFVMEHEGVDFRTAVQTISGGVVDATPRERRVIEREKAPDVWAPLPVVSDIALEMPDVKYMRAPKLDKDGKEFKVPAGVHSFTGQDGAVLVKHVVDRRWAYRNADGEIIGYIVRFNLAWGGKEVIPQTWCANAETGEHNWKWLSFAKPRPIYGLDLLAQNPKAQVLIVEGEKACDAARELFAAAGVSAARLVVVSWPGGSKAIPHVDWSPLHGRSVALWPDADQKPYTDRDPRAGQIMPFIEQVGAQAMAAIYKALAEHCPKITAILPPAGVPDGWDLADPAPDGFALMSHMKTGVPAADVFAATATAEPEPEQAPVGNLPPWDEGELAGMPDLDDHTEQPEQPPIAVKKKISRDEAQDDDGLTQNGYFRILGYDHDRYYVLQFEKCQIMVYTKGDFSDAGLIELAPLDWWELHFPGSAKTGGIDKKSAMNWIVRRAHTRGMYDMRRIRGRGAWTDNGRSVFHHGDFLTVDGEPMDITELDSNYVYEMGYALPPIDDEPLSYEEGRMLLDMAGMFRWSKPASAPLLAGWIALAPLCGAMRWRPHIWLSGGAGSGKSTVLERFVHTLMNGMDLYAQGNSSEAGIRQELKGDALPVLFDESESNTEREAMRIQGVLSLIRQASTESQAKTLKGTAGGDALSFHIRSMFCLASIQVGMKYQADMERMTVLNLLPKRDEVDAAGNWKRLSETLHLINRDETLPARLVRRSLMLLPTTLQNIKVFSEAAAIKFGSQRDGDQYGTLMAGAWSLISDDMATLEAAQIMIDGYDWSEHRENGESDEGERALAALMGALIRVNGGVEVTVHELIKVAVGDNVDTITVNMQGAEALLNRHGMRTMGRSRLYISPSSQELKRLLEGTPFEADVRGVFRRVKGADRNDNKPMKFAGVSAKVIGIPLDGLLSDEVDFSPSHDANEVVEF